MEAFPEMVAMSLYMAAPRGMTGRLVIFFSIILDFKILNKAQFCLMAQAVMFKKNQVIAKFYYFSPSKSVLSW